jgi:DNA polymerase III subunit delta'
MAWQGVEGHDAVVERFRQALCRDRLASTFLFVGPAGVGKRLFAEKLAQSLLCSEVPADRLAPCGTCDACVQVMAHTHPDLYIVEKPADKSSIPVSMFIGDDAHRMREGLCHDIALKPFMGGRKVAIIDDADRLNEEGANCLLKTLEEPPPRSVLILIGSSADAQLPTIRSRAQIIRFTPLDNSVVARLLVERGVVEDAASAERLAAMSEGSLERAAQLADDDLWEFRKQLLARLSEPQLPSVQLAHDLSAFIDAAGKEASARRLRANQVIGFALDFFRQLLRAHSGSEALGDRELIGAANRARVAAVRDAETAIACIDRTVEALVQIDRNAHLPTLVECWLDDLARIEYTGYGVATYGT